MSKKMRYLALALIMIGSLFLTILPVSVSAAAPTTEYFDPHI